MPNGSDVINMRVLVVYYSRTGHTAGLANALIKELRQLGMEVTTEEIKVKRDWNKWLLPIPLLPLLPMLPIYLASKRFRRFWHDTYRQQEQAIQALAFPDVSDFDLVLLGTPKWLYISYPVARWLNTVTGLKGKKVATFATFCGPPLRVFEIEMLFEPMEARLRSHGAIVSERLAISSDYHPYFFFDEMRRLFRWISIKAFRRPLVDFTLGGAVGQSELKRFLGRLMKT